MAHFEVLFDCSTDLKTKSGAYNEDDNLFLMTLIRHLDKK